MNSSTQEPTGHKIVNDTEKLHQKGVGMALRSEFVENRRAKKSDTWKNCGNYHKIWTMWFYHKITAKHADGMANCLEPNQIAPDFPDQSVRKLRIIMVPRDTRQFATPLSMTGTERSCWGIPFIHTLASVWPFHAWFSTENTSKCLVKPHFWSSKILCHVLDFPSTMNIHVVYFQMLSRAPFWMVQDFIPFSCLAFFSTIWRKSCTLR